MSLGSLGHKSQFWKWNNVEVQPSRGIQVPRERPFRNVTARADQLLLRDARYCTVTTRYPLPAPPTERFFAIARATRASTGPHSDAAELGGALAAALDTLLALGIRARATRASTGPHSDAAELGGAFAAALDALFGRLGVDIKLEISGASAARPGLLGDAL